MKNIVVGLDGSPRQPLVLEQARAIAQAQGGKLHLVRAMTLPAVPSTLWAVSNGDVERFLVEHGTQELEAVVTTLPKELVGGIHTSIGQPADVICRLASELDADLVVIGSHSYDGIDRLLGTTAAKVVNRAPVSVLVVRPRA